MLSKNNKYLLVLIFLAMIWGSSYILIERALVSFSPVQVASLRIVFSSIVLIPFVRKVKKQEIFFMLCISFFGSGLPTFIYPYAIEHIDGSVAGIINSLTPVFTVLFGFVLFRTQINITQTIGLILAFIGATLIILYGTSESNFSLNKYALIAVLAPMFYGLSTNIQKAKLSHFNPLSLTANTFVLLLPFALFVLNRTNFLDRLKIEPMAWQSMGFVAVLGVVGTAFALAIFNVLIKNTSAIFATSVTFLMPIVVLFWGVYDHDNIGIYHIIGLILILLGVYTLNFLGKKTNLK